MAHHSAAALFMEQMQLCIFISYFNISGNVYLGLAANLAFCNKKLEAFFIDIQFQPPKYIHY